MNRGQGGGERLIAVIGRAEGTAIASSVDAAQSSSRCSRERFAVTGIAVDGIRDCGYCWRLAPVACMIFSFLWPARDHTAAIVVPWVCWCRKRQLPITAAARRLSAHKTRLRIWVVLNSVVSGRALLVSSSRQWVPRLLLLAAAAILFSAFEASKALHPRRERTTLGWSFCNAQVSLLSPVFGPSDSGDARYAPAAV